MKTLVASDYENVYKVYLFLSAIIDKCCGSTEAAETTTAFAQYVNIVRKTDKR